MFNSREAHFASTNKTTSIIIPGGQKIMGLEESKVFKGFLHPDIHVATRAETGQKDDSAGWKNCKCFPIENFEKPFQSTNCFTLNVWPSS